MRWDGLKIHLEILWMLKVMMLKKAHLFDVAHLLAHHQNERTKMRQYQIKI
jgi:hypothetical protein